MTPGSVRAANAKSISLSSWLLRMSSPSLAVARLPQAGSSAALSKSAKKSKSSASESHKNHRRGVEMFRKLLDEGGSGDNVGLLLRGIQKEDIERGMVLVKPGSRELYKTVCNPSPTSSSRG